MNDFRDNLVFLLIDVFKFFKNLNLKLHFGNVQMSKINDIQIELKNKQK